MTEPWSGPRDDGGDGAGDDDDATFPTHHARVVSEVQLRRSRVLWIDLVSANLVPLRSADDGDDGCDPRQFLFNDIDGSFRGCTYCGPIG